MTYELPTNSVARSCSDDTGTRPDCIPDTIPRVMACRIRLGADAAGKLVMLATSARVKVIRPHSWRTFCSWAVRQPTVFDGVRDVCALNPTWASIHEQDGGHEVVVFPSRPLTETESVPAWTSNRRRTEILRLRITVYVRPLFRRSAQNGCELADDFINILSVPRQAHENLIGPRRKQK